MFAGNVFFRGDEYAAKSALPEALRLAHSVSFARQASGLDSLVKTYELEDGTIVEIVDSFTLQTMTIIPPPAPGEKEVPVEERGRLEKLVLCDSVGVGLYTSASMDMGTARIRIDERNECIYVVFSETNDTRQDSYDMDVPVYKGQGCPPGDYYNTQNLSGTVNTEVLFITKLALYTLDVLKTVSYLNTHQTLKGYAFNLLNMHVSDEGLHLIGNHRELKGTVGHYLNANWPLPFPKNYFYFYPEELGLRVIEFDSDLTRTADSVIVFDDAGSQIQYCLCDITFSPDSLTCSNYAYGPHTRRHPQYRSSAVNTTTGELYVVVDFDSYRQYGTDYYGYPHTDPLAFGSIIKVVGGSPAGDYRWKFQGYNIAVDSVTGDVYATLKALSDYPVGDSVYPGFAYAGYTMLAHLDSGLGLIDYTYFDSQLGPYTRLAAHNGDVRTVVPVAGGTSYGYLHAQKRDRNLNLISAAAYYKYTPWTSFSSFVSNTYTLDARYNEDGEPAWLYYGSVFYKGAFYDQNVLTRDFDILTCRGQTPTPPELVDDEGWYDPELVSVEEDVQLKFLTIVDFYPGDIDKVARISFARTTEKAHGYQYPSNIVELGAVGFPVCGIVNRVHYDNFPYVWGDQTINASCSEPSLSTVTGAPHILVSETLNVDGPYAL